MSLVNWSAFLAINIQILCQFCKNRVLLQSLESNYSAADRVSMKPRNHMLLWSYKILRICFRKPRFLTFVILHFILIYICTLRVRSRWVQWHSQTLLSDHTASAAAWDIFKFPKKVRIAPNLPFPPPSPLKGMHHSHLPYPACHCCCASHCGGKENSCPTQARLHGSWAQPRTGAAAVAGRWVSVLVLPQDEPSPQAAKLEWAGAPLSLRTQWQVGEGKEMCLWAGKGEGKFFLPWRLKNVPHCCMVWSGAG